MVKVLVIAECEQSLTNATLTTIGAAMRIASTVDVLVASDGRALAQETANVQGVEQVLLYQNERYQSILAEDLAEVILKEAPHYTHILAPATTFGKNVMPRVAARLKVMQISDIVSIESEEVFIRPLYAGNAFAKVQSLDNIKVITVRPTAFASAILQKETATITLRECALKTQRVQFVQRLPSVSKRPDLTCAKVVIAGGRGLKNADNFRMLEKLADLLGAAIGASRAAVDAGFISNDYQIGQTGKVVAPTLYIAVGISGAIQHLAGILESKIIVAINQDPDAPIFDVADYSLVGDLFKLIPELCEVLKEKKYGVC